MDSPSAFRLYSDSELFTSSPVSSSTNFDQTSYTHQSYLPSLRTQLSFDQAKTTIQDTVGFEPRDGQVEALLHLYHGRDYVLVAPCGWGKTLVITGLPLLYPPDTPSIILIVSPLKSIQQDQSSALQKELGDRFKPFVLDGNSNTAENRMKIATGVYTHVWLSAEVAIGYVGKEGEKRKKKKVRFPCGYQDDGEFLSVLLHDAFRDRLALVAIDELHLNTKQEWGGSFRPAMGQLRTLRQRLPCGVPLFGTTATLTRSMFEEVVESAGFRRDRILHREPINRPSILLHFEVTADFIPLQKRVVGTIAGLDKSTGVRRPHLLPKAIFFVETITESISLRSNIILWLQEFGYRAPQSVIKLYHAQLTDETRIKIQNDFNSGVLRIVVCTVAFAVGVNPRDVKIICQTGRCNLAAAIQKGGRGGRQGGGEPESESLFVWLVPPRVVGERALASSATTQSQSGRGQSSQLSRLSQVLLSQPSQALPSQPSQASLPSRFQSTTIEDLDGYGSDTSDASASSSIASSIVSTVPGIETSAPQKQKVKRLTDPEWRALRMHEGEWELWNSPRCCRVLLHLPFEEVISEDPKYNCQNCCRCVGSLLPNLPRGIADERTEPCLRRFVGERLKALRTRIGAKYLNHVPPHPLTLGQGEQDPGIIILPNNIIKRLSDRYPAVARGELFGWMWQDRYGEEVVRTVRDAISWVEPAPRIQPPPAVPTGLPPITLAALQLPQTTSAALQLPPTIPTAPQLPPTTPAAPQQPPTTPAIPPSIATAPEGQQRRALKDITNTAVNTRGTSRGTPAIKKGKGQRGNAVRRRRRGAREVV